MKANSPPGRVGGTVKPGPLESSITVGFFEENTHVPSGARIPTRHMAMDKIEMYGLYRAHFPALVRRAAELSEEKQEVHGGLCGFLKKSLVVANEMSARPAWTQKSELDRRVQWYERKSARPLQWPECHPNSRRSRQHQGSLYVNFLAHFEEK